MRASRRAGLLLGWAWVLCLALVGHWAWAHGDGHERIEALSRRLAREPANVDLLLQRADARRAHGHAKDALADLDRARALGAPPERWRLPRARLWLDQGEAAQALSLIEQHLQDEATDTVAMAWRAQALSALGRHGDAALQWALRLPLVLTPEVSDYLIWAQTHQRAGNLPAAVGALDAGLARLGPLVVLQRQAVEWLEGQQQWPQALHRLQTLIDGSPRKENLLWWRSRMEQAAGLPEQARASRAAALAAWQSLPAAVRATPAMQALGRELREP